jgi:hypothetical protein
MTAVSFRFEPKKAEKSKRAFRFSRRHAACVCVVFECGWRVGVWGVVRRGGVGWKARTCAMPALSSRNILVLDLLCSCYAFCELNSSRSLDPSSVAYSQYSPMYNNAVVNHPGLIYLANSAEDVASALCYAKNNGLSVRVKAGGHSYTGESACDDPDCLQIDLSTMKDIWYDNITSLVSISPGLRSQEIYTELDPMGRTVVTGTCLPVGYAGLALGGGFGVLSRQFGLAADQIVGFEIVLANSTIINTHDGEHPELFWALRGGGHSNFGIVTNFLVKTIDVSQTKFQFRLYNAKTTSQSAEALLMWQAFSETADRRVIQTVFTLGKYSTYAPSFSIQYVYNGTSVDADAVFSQSGLLAYVTKATCKKGSLNPMNQSQPPLPFGCDDMPYSNLHDLIGYCGFETDRFFVANSRYQSTDLDQSSANKIWSAFSSIDSSYHCIPQWADLMFDAHMGAISDKTSSETAFPHRAALFQLQYNLFWEYTSNAPPGCIDWFNSFYASTSPLFLVNASYANYPNTDLENFGMCYFDDNYSRLQALKGSIDPSNFFQYEQSIVAA